MYENEYVGDLPEYDADLTDAISWAHLPGSGYSESVSLATKYADHSRCSRIPKNLLAFDLHRFQSIGDELAHTASIQVNVPSKKRKSVDIVGGNSAPRSVVARVHTPDLMESASSPSQPLLEDTSHVHNEIAEDIDSENVLPDADLRNSERVESGALNTVVSRLEDPSVDRPIQTPESESQHLVPYKDAAVDCELALDPCMKDSLVDLVQMSPFRNPSPLHSDGGRLQEYVGPDESTVPDRLLEVGRSNLSDYSEVLGSGSSHLSSGGRPMSSVEKVQCLESPPEARVSPVVLDADTDNESPVLLECSGTDVGVPVLDASVTVVPPAPDPYDRPREDPLQILSMVACSTKQSTVDVPTRTPTELDMEGEAREKLRCPSENVSTKLVASKVMRKSTRQAIQEVMISRAFCSVPLCLSILNMMSLNVLYFLRHLNVCFCN